MEGFYVELLENAQLLFFSFWFAQVHKLKNIAMKWHPRSFIVKSLKMFPLKLHLKSYDDSNDLLWIFLFSKIKWFVTYDSQLLELVIKHILDNYNYSLTEKQSRIPTHIS